MLRFPQKCRLRTALKKNRLKCHIFIHKILILLLEFLESPLDQDTFRRWQEDNELFIRTKACKKVEKLTKRQNLVMVVGHSGSGKSAIIQHIALKYRSQGWIVKPMNEVTEIIRAYSLRQVSETNTLFILNDPIGKESFDEIAYNSWKKHEVHLEDILMKMKLLLS